MRQPATAEELRVLDAELNSAHLQLAQHGQTRSGSMEAWSACKRAQTRMLCLLPGVHFFTSDEMRIFARAHRLETDWNALPLL
jgi:hypothetical protein